MLSVILDLYYIHFAIGPPRDSILTFRTHSSDYIVRPACLPLGHQGQEKKAFNGHALYTSRFLHIFD